MFDNPIFNYLDIQDIAQYQAAISNATVSTSYKGNKSTYYYNNGIEGYLLDILEDKPISDMIRFKKDVKYFVEKKDRDDEISIDLAFAFSNTNNKTTHIELLNGSLLDLHGTPYEGIVNGLKNAINRKIRDLNLYNKNEKQIINDDVLMSLNHALDLKSLLTEYTNQSKRSSLSEHYKIVLQKEIEEFMNIFFIENEIEAKKICNQILINKRAREKSFRMMENVKKKLSEEITVFNKIPGLIECKSKDRKNNILCICEGKSALGSLIAARGDNHSLMALRGKIRNCKKSTLDQIFSDPIVTDIIRAIGAGVEIKSKANKEFTTFDIEKMRYGKIYIVVDADVDGMGSILPLLLTMFDTLLPTLIEKGYLWLCETPRYEILCEDKYYYAINDEELSEIENMLKDKKYKVFYVKGLAELNADTMAMCLSPDYKNVTQIRADDIVKARKSLDLHMGNDIKSRKEYIMENFDNVGGNM